MTQYFDQAKSLIERSQKILLTMHERMDGDDGGSVLALAHHLEKMGKRVSCAIKKGVPQSLKFLSGSQNITDDIDSEDFDLLITFGCSDLSRTGSNKIFSLKSKILNLKSINIDHHPDNKLFGEVNLVDPEKSSVAELVYEFFIYNEWPISKEVATCLLTGIVTDTGCFRHSNTQSSTLKSAGELLKRGADLHTIIKNTFKNKNPESLSAWGKALKNTFYDEHSKIIYSVMTEEDLQKLEGNLPQNVFEGFVETLNTVPEARFAMFLKQEGQIIKGSLRSEQRKGVDVSALARVFGGGGHKLAAGFSVAGKLVKDETGKWKVI